MRRNRLTKFAVTILGSVVLVSCNQQEADKLRAENEALKARVLLLKKENEELRETAKNYYIKAVDLLNSRSPEALQKAINILSQLIVKFPGSPYVKHAETKISEIRAEISTLKKINRLKAKFDQDISKRKFEEASSDLRNLKSLIRHEEYLALSEKLYEERHKPVATTINKLISEFGTLNKSLDPNIFNFIGMRVQFDATFASVDRSRKALLAYSDGWGKGSQIEVFYDNTNMEGYFTNADPECCSNRYRVVGKTQIYGNTGGLYIQAEKIDLINH